MEITMGVVEKIRQPMRKSCGDILYLRIDDKSLKEYRGCLTEKEAKVILGQEVTVWSQRQILILKTVDYINQIQLGDRLVKDYREIKPNREKDRDNSPGVIRFFTILAVLPLIVVWWFNRKDVHSENIVRNNNKQN